METDATVNIRRSFFKHLEYVHAGTRTVLFLELIESRVNP